jgi:phage terminase Nu1 subunit (DNA packaging protein)
LVFTMSAKAKSDRFMMTTSEVAELVGVSKTAVSKWSLEPAGERGRAKVYDAREVVAYLRQRDSGRHTEYSQARAAWMKARAEQAQLDLAVRAGQLAELDQVKAVWAELVGAARSRFLALPHRAGLLVGLTEKEIFVALKELVWDALDQLSRDGSTTAGGDGAEAREDRGAVSAPDAKGGD